MKQKRFTIALTTAALLGGVPAAVPVRDDVEVAITESQVPPATSSGTASRA